MLDLYHNKGDDLNNDGLPDRVVDDLANQMYAI